MVGGLLISVFVLGVRTQMVQPVFAAPAAPVKGGAKVSIANFGVHAGRDHNRSRRDRDVDQ